MLSILSRQRSIYRTIEERSSYLEGGIRGNLKKLGIGYRFNRVGSMFTLFFTTKEVFDYETSKTSDTKKYSVYFNEMLRRGIYLPPSQFEAAFVSSAHGEREIEKTIKANYAALKATLTR